jgi:hypothetical protein
VTQLESLYYHSKSQGLMIYIRIMLYFQRVVGLYFARPGPSLSRSGPVLDFDRLADELRMSYEILPRVPDTWLFGPAHPSP